MIVADERANKGLEVFDLMGAQGFEMKNETLQMCANEDGTLSGSVRTLNLLDKDGNKVLSLSWTETGVCGLLNDDNFSVEIKEELGTVGGMTDRCAGSPEVGNHRKEARDLLRAPLRPEVWLRAAWAGFRIQCRFVGSSQPMITAF